MVGYWWFYLLDKILVNIFFRFLVRFIFSNYLISRLKQITNESIDETLKSVKSIIGNAADQVLFVGDGICGTNKTFPSNTVSLKPSDFDFMNILQVDPRSNMGQTLYEGKSNGSVQMNTELFNLFNSALI